jgi:hypothetical protein
MAYQKILIKDAEGNHFIGSPTFDENDQAVVTIAYESDEANTTGVGLSFDFSGSGISIVSVDNVFAGAIADGAQSGDGDKQSLDFGWASLFGQFPGSETADLATITLEKIGGNTQVSLDFNSSAAGYDQVNDNPYVEPPALEISVASIAENSGENQVIATVEGGDEGASYSLVEAVPDAPVAPEQEEKTQHVYISDSQLSDDGSQVTVTVAYMADEANLSGIGLAVDFDSSVFTLNSISDVYDGAIASGEQSGTGNDQSLAFGWASLFGQFPGTETANLATITFDVADGASGASEIGITATSNAAGYAFDGQGFNVQFPEVSPLIIDPVTGAVTLTDNPDFESVPVYDFEIVDNNSGRKGTASVSIVNVDEASPVFASATAEVTIAEDAEGVIYTASADDTADVSAGVSYSLAGADAAAFSISAGGAITPVAVDYEAKTSYSVTIIANDGVTSVAEQVLTVNVTNIDEKPPIFSSLDSATVVENVSAVIYEAAAADDPSDLVSNPVKYSLSDNPDNLLTIDELTGVVTLAAAPDFEAKPSYTFTVTATDNAGKSADQTVTVTVEDADEIGPSVNAVDAADLNINEDTILTPMPVGTVVYTATATDSVADTQADGPITFSLVNVDKDSNDKPLAVINEDTGQVTLTEIPDFEGARQSYSFSVVATDAAGNHSAPHEVTLSVVNRPDAKPSWDSVNAVNVDENTANAVIYNAKAEAHSLDGQEVSIVNYELVDENGDLSSTVGPFTVSADGAVTFNGNLDYEDTQTHSFTLVATDSAGYKSDELDVALNVNDLDELAPIVSGQTGAVELTNGTGPNQVVFDPQNSVLGESAVDNANDKSDGLNFELRFDADNQQYAGDFAIDTATGKVTYLPDPSGAATINYSVAVTDAAGNVAVDANGDLLAEIPLSVEILDVEYDVPVFATPAGYTAVVETEVVQKAGTSNEEYVNFVQSVVRDDLTGIGSGDVVYEIGVDPASRYVTDATTNLKYTVTPAILVDENVSSTGALFSANAAGSISIDENTGAVRLVGQPWADGADSYSFTVTATDTTGNESYQIVTLTNLDTYEGTADPVATDITYSIVDAQAPEPANADAVGINPESYVVDTQGLGIDPKSGDVYFVDAADYETQDRYVFKVVGSDGSEQVVSLHVVDTDDVAPVITVENTAASVDENTSSVSVVANVSAADDSAVTLSLSGDDAGSFSIDAAGVVSTKAGIKIDHELQSEYNFNVVATDAAGNSSEEAVSLQVNDLDEQGPVFTSANAIRIDENESNVIYTAAAHHSGSLVSKGAIAQEFVQNDDGTLTVKFSVDASVYSTDDNKVEVADFDFTYAADHHGILKVESIEYPSDPFLKLANTEVDGQINFRLGLSEFNPYTVGGDVALAEVTFKVGDPMVAATFGVSNVVLGSTLQNSLQPGATVNNYVMAVDQEGITLADEITLSLENPDDGFAINASGNVTVTNADFETAEERSFTVVATDASGNESKQTVSVSLNDLDEVAPVFNSAAVELAVDENSGSGQVVYTATVDDSADTSAGVTFSLEGADAGAFVIDADSGEVTLLDNPDFETQAAYNFAVKASDGVQSSVQAVSLDINNIDEEAPTITSGDGSGADGVDENTRFGDNEDDATNGIIYRTTADDDADISGGVTFTLADTNSEALQINENGAVFINVAANHESLAQYSFTVVATDAAGNSSREAVTIDVNDLDEVKPVFASGSTALSVDENVVVDDDAPELAPVVVYKAIADDSSDISDGVTFELTADSDDLFDIISSTGEVFLTRSPDFEHKSNRVDAAAVEGYVHGFEVVALDGANATFSGRISVAINDLDEVEPKITSGDSAGTIVENSGSNQVVYTATATDVHADEAATDGFTFALGGHDADSFTIDAVTGEVRLLDNADEDTKDQYSFTVSATDAAGHTSDAETVTLTVTPESQIVVAHIGSNDHIRGVKITDTVTDTGTDEVTLVYKGESNGRHATAIDVDEAASVLSVEKNIEVQDVKNIVTSADALTVLKMAIGLHTVSVGDTYKYNSVLDFNGDNKVTDYDLINTSADITNDKKVTSRDALEILKISAGIASEHNAEWMFAQVESDSIQDTVTYKGFVRGDVNNSWNNSDEVSAARENKAPEITSGDAIAVMSSAQVGDVIYKVAADDDAYEVTYSMDDAPAGLSFNVSTGAVSIANVSVLDGPFAFTVTATDSEGLSDSKVVTATVDAKDTEAPIITVDSILDGNIEESDAENQVVFKVSADESVTYSLGAGSDPALSVNAQGEVTLSNTADEDIQSEYHFTLIATDAAGNATKEAHVIEVAARDEVAPTIVSADRAHSIDENSLPVKPIYKVKATDSDHAGSQNIHYDLMDDLNGLLDIDHSTGEVTLMNSVDYETDAEITFTVVADDGTKYSTKDVTIAINDVDEQAPVLTIEDTAENVITDTALSIEEHSGAGQLVFKASATDVHEGLEAKSNGVSFSLAEEGDYQAFTIDAKTGEVRLNVDPDREGDSPQSSYTITVIASDGQDQSSQTVTLNIDDIDEVAPVITLEAVSSYVEENSDAGHVAYSVSASDDSTFELFLSADSDSAVSLENGNIVLNESPDHEMQREYNFTVVATDSEGNSSSESGSISVIDVDDAKPTMNAETKGSIVEGDHEGTVLYSADASDAADDKGSQISYELVVNSALVVGSAQPVEAAAGVQKVYVGSDTVQDGNQIEVDVDYLADSNELTGLGLRVHYDSSKLSFVEMSNVFSEDLIFESENFEDADDPSASYVAVAWASVDGDWTGGELPENLFSAVFDVLADETTATQISFSAIDNDMAYEFEGVAHDIKLSPLSIDSQGNVSLDSDFKADFESLSEIEFTVVATDSANNVTSRDVVISVENKDEKPPVIDSGSDAGVIVENTGAGQLIYTATSVDTDDVSQSSAKYSLEAVEGSELNPSLIINSKTGDVYLLDNPDYEVGDTIDFKVVVSDATGENTSENVTLNVSNLDEVAPVITSGLAGDNVDENAPGSKVVYAATAVNNTDTDDVSDLSVSYSLASDSDAAFSINTDSGAVSFNEIADYETKADYSFTVVATDISGESTSQTVTVGVNNLDEVAPTITSSASAGALNETHETNESFSPTVVYTATASDVHGDVEKATSDTITFALSGADASAFSIDSSTGVVTLTQSPNFEAQSSYSFDVVATEGTFITDPVTGEDITDPVTGEVLIKPGNSSTAETVTLTINNVDEIKPEITSSDTAKAVSDSAAVIYTATAEDSGDGSNGNITFSLTDESVVSIDPSSGEVTVNSGADLLSAVDFTVVATDDNGNSSEKAVSIPVISDVATASPVTTLGEGAPVNEDGETVNNGIVHSYTNNSDGSVTLKLSVSANTGINASELDSFNFDLTSTSVINLDSLSITDAATASITNVVAGSGGKGVSVAIAYFENAAIVGEPLLEYTFAPAGDTFTVSNIFIGSEEEEMVDSSSTLAVLPEIGGSAGDDVVVLKDGFANVDLVDGADTLIIDPDYNANMVIDFVSGVDSIDMTRILDDADYGEGDALQVSGSTPDIADLVSNGDESLDNAFGGYFNDDTDVLTLFVDADSSAGVTKVESIEVTLRDGSDFNDDDLSVNFVHFIA